MVISHKSTNKKLLQNNLLCLATVAAAPSPQFTIERWNNTVRRKYILFFVLKEDCQNRVLVKERGKPPSKHPWALEMAYS